MAKTATLKTIPTENSVEDFLSAVGDETKRNDCLLILEMMKKASGESPRLWGSSIIGFGEKRFKSPASGREVDWFKIGFSPRKSNISLYLIMDINAQQELLKDLGKHKTGAGCLYINKLSDVDMKILKQLIVVSLRNK